MHWNHYSVHQLSQQQYYKKSVRSTYKSAFWVEKHSKNVQTVKIVSGKSRISRQIIDLTECHVFHGKQLIAQKHIHHIHHIHHIRLLDRNDRTHLLKYTCNKRRI